MTKVKLPTDSWLKRYLDEKKWYQIRTDILYFEIKRAFPYDWERIIFNMKEGKMTCTTKYAEYMYLTDSIDSDELLFN